MKKLHLILTVSLVLLAKGESAVVVTYRGDAPNLIGTGLESSASLDINLDGVMDFRFRKDYFTAVIYGYGDNRFISGLSTGTDLGGEVLPVYQGGIIGSDTALLPGDWHQHTDNGGETGFGLTVLQSISAYIAVEFEAADGIHYGWISYTGWSTPKLFPVYDTNGNIIGYHEGIEDPGGIIDSWAWETIPGKPIVAGTVPEPGSLLLCLSAGVLGLLRRRRGQ